MPTKIGVLVSMNRSTRRGCPDVSRPCRCGLGGRATVRDPVGEAMGAATRAFLRPRRAGQWGDGLPPPSPCYGRSGSGSGNIQGARDRLIRLAEAHPEWVLGYQDEVWWSRLARPGLHAWAGEEPMRLQEPPSDADPKALACYGILRADTGGMMLRLVPGRPGRQGAQGLLGRGRGRPAGAGERAA